MFPQDIIRKKRDKGTLSQEEINFFIKGVVEGYFQDYQSSALLMAIFLNGMNDEETVWLTKAMMESGDIIDLSEIDAPKVDKHSTGGVGDKVSLILAPLAASCGVCVPMISGRGLGHTGGTLDKLQSIPGFRVDLTEEEYKNQLKKIGVALAGQTHRFVPADKKLYAIRDVTATVESIPLICASIMSKKLAEGIDSLVLDVKTGNGAFMKDYDKAKTLAQKMVKIGNSMGKKTIALLTDMNQPLGEMVGNSLEVIESLECLKNKGPKDLEEVTLELTANMIVLAKIEKDIDKAKKLAKTKLESGEALEKMKEIIEAQGGNPKIIDDYSLLPQAQYKEDIIYEGKEGYIHEISAYKIGIASMTLGAGREKVTDKIDPAVGITEIPKVGREIKKGDKLCKIYYNEKNKRDKAYEIIRSAFVIKEEKPEIKYKLIYEKITE